VTKQVEPLLQAVAPLAEPAGQRRLSGTARDLAAAARTVPGLADRAREAADIAASIATDLQRSDLAGTLSAVRALTDVALSGDRLARTLDSGGRVLSALDRAGLPTLIDNADEAFSELTSKPVVTSLSRCDRLLSGRRRGTEGRVGCLLRVVPNFRSLLRSLRRLNRITAITQVETLSVLKQSLSVQSETLKSVRSIDRKTGGPPPSAPVAPALP